MVGRYALLRDVVTRRRSWQRGPALHEPHHEPEPDWAPAGRRRRLAGTQDVDRHTLASAWQVTVSRPVGGVLSTPLRGMGGHPSTRPTWGCPVSRADGQPMSPTWPCSGWGLPSRAGRPDAGALLPHRFTLACAVSGHRRSVLCGTFLRVAPTRFASTLPCGAPTFLDAEAPRPPSRLTVRSESATSARGAPRRRTPSLASDEMLFERPERGHPVDLAALRRADRPTWTIATAGRSQVWVSARSRSSPSTAPVTATSTWWIPPRADVRRRR